MCENTLLYWKVLKAVQQTSTQIDELHCEAEDEKTLKYDALFNIEYWYSRFSKFTFPTDFVALSREEATAMMERYQQLIHAKPIQDNQILDSLACRIDEHTKKLQIEDGFFIRLSSRSPKDASFADSKMKTLLQNKLASISKESDPEEIQNLEFTAFFESQIDSLKIHSGKEALDLLCSSERVFVDLQRAFSLQSMAGVWNVNIVLRKWVTFHISEEFRTFIYNRNLTAISQYFDMLFFPKFTRSFKQNVLARIQQFVEQVRNELPYENCVLDLAVTEHGIYCIEFNGFFRFTSPCLFNWKEDLDTLQGLKPLEFRTVKNPLPVLRDSSRDNTLPQIAKDPFGMSQEAADNDLAETQEDVMKILKDFMEDDLERINSNLRYILNKRTYLSKQKESES